MLHDLAMMFNIRKKETTKFKIGEFIMYVEDLLHVSAAFAAIFREMLHK
jgi:hypothetical protein